MAKNNDISKNNSASHSNQESSATEQGTIQTSYQLRLFVTGSTSRSQQAIQNIREICEQYLPGQYELEIIDVSQDPQKTREYQILALPTLLKELPEPLRKVVGDLSEKEKVLEAMDIQPKK